MGFTAQEVRIILSAFPEDWEVMIEYKENGELKRVPFNTIRTIDSKNMVVLKTGRGK